MAEAKTKNELIVQVWRSLKRETVGAEELKVIELALRERFGDGAVEMPMKIARVLADAGAKLKYPEIMDLDFQRRSQSVQESIFSAIRGFDSIEDAITSIKNLENLRKEFIREKNKKGLNLLSQIIAKTRQRILFDLKEKRPGIGKFEEKHEIAEWLRIYLESPDLFEKWIELRFLSDEFREKFLK
jgi:hypothetical protein